MSNIVVIYHSGYGHTQRLAQEIAKAAEAELIAIDALGQITASDWLLLDAADGMIMGSPTYMGGVSWQFKRFADDSSKRWYARTWKNKWAAGFTISANLSGDKLSTLQYFVTLAMQHGMFWIGQAEPHVESEGINRLGSSLGVMAQCGAQDPATRIPVGDLATAAALGHRVSEIVHQSRGRT